MTSGSRSMASNSARRRVRVAPTLLTIPQGRDGEMKGFGKFRLRHTETASQRLDARDPTHLRQLLGSQRLHVGIGPCGGQDLLVGHRIEPRPIGIAPRQWITR
jgi:hypothetical protein